MRRLSLPLQHLLASAAGAESLRVGVWYPANSDQAAALRSIQVEPFGGDAGDDLTVQVEDVLRGIDLVYRQALPLAQRLYLTEVAQDFAADAFFPEFSASGGLKSRARRRGDGAGLDFTFAVYERA